MNLFKRDKKLITPEKTLFYKDIERYNELDRTQRFHIKEEDLFPCLSDKTEQTLFDAHYIYHPAWAARILQKITPSVHVDISSTLHFCSIISAFIETRFYDYRPAKLNLDNLNSAHADLTQLHFDSNSIDSLSCMHTLEHIGLGRYGDPIDPEGDIKAIEELKRVCSNKGNLLIVVPVGVRRLQFNAHRIYNPKDILNYMGNEFELNNFALVDDNADFFHEADIDYAATQKYGCGCYWFVKTKL